MRTPLLMLAVTATALSLGIASAQSSVTLYGTLATGLVYSSNVRGGAYAGELDNDHWNSAVGLKGKEDLGGGLSAVFKLQMANPAFQWRAVRSGRLHAALLQGIRRTGRRTTGHRHRRATA